VKEEVGGGGHLCFERDLEVHIICSAAIFSNNVNSCVRQIA